MADRDKIKSNIPRGFKGLWEIFKGGGSYGIFDKFRSSEIISKRIFDLLEIIKHVLFIDSIVINNNGRNLEIEMPIYDLDFWKQKNVNKELEHLLFYFTRNYWKFKFYLDKSTYPSQNLTINFKPEEYEVALWSGGLDAYAGFINIMLPANSGLDQSISACPETYLRCLDFFELVSDEKMRIQNPFGFYTKGQVCKKINDKFLIDLLFETSSCDSRVRIAPCECGGCTSCILRRISIHVAGLQDRTGYVTSIVELKHQKAYLVMKEQVEIFRELFSNRNISGLYELSANLVINREACEKLFGIDKQEFEKNVFSYIENYIIEWDKFEVYLNIPQIPKQIESHLKLEVVHA